MKTILCAAACVVASSLHAAQEGSLTLTHTVPLAGVKGRFDHFAIDAKGERLFVAALGNDSLEIVDVAKAKRLHSITGLQKPTGVLYLADANQIAVANGDDGTFRVYDGREYKAVATLKILEDADNVRFDAKANRVYVGYGDGALAVIDPNNWKLLSRVKLPGHPESFQLESQGDRIFVNVPDSKQVAVTDRTKQGVTTRWTMQRSQANFPMALDETAHRLFVGCRKPARLVVFDTVAGKEVNDLEISGDTDDLFYDPTTKRVYISCGEGFIDLIAQRGPDRYERTNRIPTRAGARTSFFSVERREFYLAVPQHGSDPAELRIYTVAGQ
jgi:DNA-binding beta-propeller fold protein YncE